MAFRPLTFIAVMAVTLALAACGFKPLYGTGGAAGSSQVVSAMSGIVIRPIADRQGVKLRQTLSEKLHPNGASPTPRYALDVQLRSQVQELGVRPDSTTSRANMIFVATFALSENSAPVYTGSVQTIVSYNILDDQFATVTSVADAEDRAIRQLGEEIKTRLAVFFDKAAAGRQAALAR